MNHDFLLDFLRGTETLNRARLGAFGEFIFRAVLGESGAVVEPWHQDETDFIVDGLRVDVKTTAQKLEMQPEPLVPYIGRRAVGVSYAKVEFFKSGARVSIEEDEIASLEWNEVLSHWEAWSKMRSTMTGGSGATKGEAKRERDQHLAPIRREIENFFQEVGFSVRIIHRTVQSKFGTETADNMIIKYPKEDRILVYLDFRSGEIFKHNLRRVYAFPERRQRELQVLEDSRLHKQDVVDRQQVSEKFCFDDIDDLKDNWKRILT